VVLVIEAIDRLLEEVCQHVRRQATPRVGLALGARDAREDRRHRGADAPLPFGAQVIPRDACSAHAPERRRHRAQKGDRVDELVAQSERIDVQGSLARGGRGEGRHAPTIASARDGYADDLVIVQRLPMKCASSSSRLLQCTLHVSGEDALPARGRAQMPFSFVCEFF
jgi:hypothetical protein